MIKITDKHNCCGCSACAQRCPKQCITMREDSEGFLYPQVDDATCIDCGLCEKVCPIINQVSDSKPLACYAAKNTNEAVRSESSSGAVFSLLAESVIREGGVVFGARFDDSWQVVHDFTDTLEGLAAFRGSKYVQSTIGNTFKRCERFLKQRTQVLYSGTPCQISGLKHYLGKEYDNLLTVEVVCHGAPSPLIWKSYIDKISNGGFIQEINFRDKVTGWKSYSFSYKRNNTKFREEHHDNLYFRGYLGNCFVRPSCYNCPVKSGRSQSDITLGDYWSIGSSLPEFDDDKGTSAVLIWSDKGVSSIKALKQLESHEQDSTSLIQSNFLIAKSVECPAFRDSFWTHFKDKGVESALDKYGIRKESFIHKALRRIKHIVLH